MSLIIHHSGNETRPEMICDDCGEIILEGEGAILAWTPEDDRKSDIIHPKTICKRCDPARYPYWMNLHTALYHLKRNLKF